MKNIDRPDLSKFRPVIFWDTKIDFIDWEKNKRWVVQRVFSRGNVVGQEEIKRFYGEKEVERNLKSVPNSKFALRNNYQ